MLISLCVAVGTTLLYALGGAKYDEMFAIFVVHVFVFIYIQSLYNLAYIVYSIHTRFVCAPFYYFSSTTTRKDTRNAHTKHFSECQVACAIRTRMALQLFSE